MCSAWKGKRTGANWVSQEAKAGVWFDQPNVWSVWMESRRSKSRSPPPRSSRVLKGREEGAGPLSADMSNKNKNAGFGHKIPSQQSILEKKQFSNLENELLDWWSEADWETCSARTSHVWCLEWVAGWVFYCLWISQLSLHDLQTHPTVARISRIICFTSFSVKIYFKSQVWNIWFDFFFISDVRKWLYYR